MSQTGIGLARQGSGRGIVWDRPSAADLHGAGSERFGRPGRARHLSVLDFARSEQDKPAVLKEHAQAFHAGPGWLFLADKSEDVEVARYNLV